MKCLQEDNIKWKLCGFDAPPWPRFLQSGLPSSITEGIKIWSIVHGDLNPNNIIVSTEDNLALIDFRDSGIGHCYEDAITLEASVRLNWPWIKKCKSNDSIKKIWETEFSGSINTAKDLSDIHAWNLIKIIRAYTESVFSKPLSADYFYGLSYYCFRLLRISTLDDDMKRRLVVCGLVAAKKCEEIINSSK